MRVLRQWRTTVGIWLMDFGQWFGGIDDTHMGYTLPQIVERAITGNSYDDFEMLRLWWESIEENSETHHAFILWMSQGGFKRHGK